MPRAFLTSALTSDFSSFIDGTIVKHTIGVHTITGYVVSLSDDVEDVLLVVDVLQNVFDSLTDFVHAHYRYIKKVFVRESVWNTCMFQKSGRWYPCSEMKASPTVCSNAEVDAPTTPSSGTLKKTLPDAPQKAKEPHILQNNQDARTLLYEECETDACCCMLCEEATIPYASESVSIKQDEEECASELNTALLDMNAPYFDTTYPYASFVIHHYDTTYVNKVHIYWSTETGAFRVYVYDTSADKGTDISYDETYIDVMIDMLQLDGDFSLMDIDIPCFPRISARPYILIKRRDVVVRALSHYTNMSWEI